MDYSKHTLRELRDALKYKCPTHNDYKLIVKLIKNFNYHYEEYKKKDINQKIKLITVYKIAQAVMYICIAYLIIKIVS